eukprot:Sspe_Gene.62419::Locus_35032_Transcript_1_1_Confidence_1.000_Length_1224::g.62419::m.62419
MGCGVSSSQPMTEGYQAAHLLLDAVEGGDLDRVQFLLDSGFSSKGWREAGDNLTQTPRRRVSVLHYAARREEFNSRRGVALISRLAKGCDQQPGRARYDPLDGDRRTPLWEACRRCHVLIALALVRGGADPATPARDGTTPLHHAVMEDAFSEGKGLECLQLMATPEVVNVRDKSGLTPLHYAAHFGCYEAGRVLLLAGADVKAEDIHGHTPLDKAESRVPELKDREEGREAVANLLRATLQARKSFLRQTRCQSLQPSAAAMAARAATILLAAS